MPRPIEIKGAEIPLSICDISEAIALWIKKEYGIEIKPNTVQYRYASDYDDTYLEKAVVVLSRSELKNYLNKEIDPMD